MIGNLWPNSFTLSTEVSIELDLFFTTFHKGPREFFCFFTGHYANPSINLSRESFFCKVFDPYRSRKNYRLQKPTFIQHMLCWSKIKSREYAKDFSKAWYQWSYEVSNLTKLKNFAEKLYPELVPVVIQLFNIFYISGYFKTPVKQTRWNQFQKEVTNIFKI